MCVALQQIGVIVIDQSLSTEGEEAWHLDGSSSDNDNDQIP
jgi:hypothetical protein